MNAVLMMLAVTAGAAPPADWTPIIATEAAVVTMGPAKEPAPKPTPDTGMPPNTTADPLPWTPPTASAQTQPQTGVSCPGGICPLPSPVPSTVTPAETAGPAPQCNDGSCQPRMFRRWRR
jgi:hypothetical protein